jgi:hypothetical protein
MLEAAGRMGQGDHVQVTAGCQAHHRVPVGPKPPVRAADRGHDHGTQELARLVFDGGHPRMLSVLLYDPVDGLIQQRQVVRYRMRGQGADRSEAAAVQG